MYLMTRRSISEMPLGSFLVISVRTSLKASRSSVFSLLTAMA